VDWDDLRVFLAVARSGSLAEAARGLSVSYSTVSRRLAALEAGLGARLFDRSGSAYELTRAGYEMLESAKRMEAEFEALAKSVRGRDARLVGRIRIATTDALATSFMPELAEFSRRYPDIEIDLLSTPEQPLPGVRTPGLAGLIPKQALRSHSRYRVRFEVPERLRQAFARVLPVGEDHRSSSISRRASSWSSTRRLSGTMRSGGGIGFRMRR